MKRCSELNDSLRNLDAKGCRPWGDPDMSMIANEVRILTSAAYRSDDVAHSGGVGASGNRIVSWVSNDRVQCRHRNRWRGGMPTQRLSMRRIKQLLVMRFGAGASTRAIGRELGIAPSTVHEYLGRLGGGGDLRPLAADVPDESLMARLFVNAGVRAGARLHCRADWSALVQELKRPAVNLLVLWGTSIGRSTRKATRTADSVSCSVSSSGGCRQRCANSTWPGSGPSSGYSRASIAAASRTAAWDNRS